MQPNAIIAMKELGLTNFISNGMPSNEAEFLDMVRIVTGNDAQGRGILSDDLSNIGFTWSDVETKLTQMLSEYPLELLRKERNKLLDKSDWTQQPDVPEATRLAWQPYRQVLRDITQTYSSLDDVVWPEKP